MSVYHHAIKGAIEGYGAVQPDGWMEITLTRPHTIRGEAYETGDIVVVNQAFITSIDTEEETGEVPF